MASLLAFLAPCLAATDASSVASRLAKEARKAEDLGQLVRAYLLYAEAAARDPKTPAYTIHRESLAPLAKLLTKSNVENVDVSADIKTAEAESAVLEPEPPLDPLSAVESPQSNSLQSTSLQSTSLQSLPHLAPNGSLHDFDLRLDQKAAIFQVARSYGIEVVFDPDFDSKPLGRFHLDQADFLTAMEAITQVTGTFVFPVSPRAMFVARDTEPKRSEFEPVVVVSVPIPDATNPKDIIEAANAIRGVLSLRTVAWDSANNTIVIRDRVTRARIAASVLDALILPRAQLSIEVQILAVDSDVSYHYGAALPTSFPAFNFAHIGAIKSILPDLTNAAALFAFGSGTNFFGLALGNATLFAMYSKSTSHVLYDATIAVGDGETASLHVGDKYPIPTSLYSGFQQSAGSIYNPIGQVTMEDLGLVLKVGARAHGDGDIGLDIDAAYKALGTTVLNTVPSVAQREFKGSVRLREHEYAIIAGMDSDQRTSSRNGLAGLADIPGINQVLAENTRDHKASNTLILIKPTITRLPMSDTISPQYLLGPQHGSRVLL